VNCGRRRVAEVSPGQSFPDRGAVREQAGRYLNMGALVCRSLPWHALRGSHKQVYGGQSLSTSKLQHKERESFPSEGFNVVKGIKIISTLILF